MHRSNAAGDERRLKPRNHGVTSPAAWETSGEAASKSACTTTITRRTLVFLAALALLILAGGICGPAGGLTSSSARKQTQPVGLQVVNGTGHSDNPASAAGANSSDFNSVGGSSTTQMGSAGLNAADKEENGGGGTGKSPSEGNLSLAREEQQEDTCPPCEATFGKLDGTEQRVELQLRGEPKSGTSFMYEWAVNALMVTCSRLGALYGRDTCHVSWRRAAARNKTLSLVTAGTKSTEMKEVLLLFEPKRNQHGARPDGRNSTGSLDARCPCENVESVSVTISSLYKHDLPVSKKCPWQHVDGVTPAGKGCKTVAGRPVRNHTDTAKCLHETPCKIKDSRLQMLILRDPRPVVVSSFFYLKTHKPSASRRSGRGESVDRFAVRMLPTICRFVHLRWLLLQERLADKTVEFVYDDSLADPLDWHQRWLSSVGLTPPKSVVQEATDTALRKEYGFAGKGVDKHPGGQQATPARSWEDEVSAEVAERLNGICRVWLPPVLLEKFGIIIDPPP